MVGSKVRAVRKGREGNLRTKMPQDVPAKQVAHAAEMNFAPGMSCPCRNQGLLKGFLGPAEAKKSLNIHGRS